MSVNPNTKSVADDAATDLDLDDGVSPVTVLPLARGSLDPSDAVEVENTRYDVFAPRFTLKNIVTEVLVVSVYDGDTFNCVFGIPEMFGGQQFRWSCRIVGIDTPELRGSGPREKALGIMARDWVRGRILNQRINIDIQGFDKYGRLLVVPRDTNGLLLSDQLVAEGMATPYFGKGQKTDWENFDDKQKK